MELSLIIDKDYFLTLNFIKLKEINYNDMICLNYTLKNMMRYHFKIRVSKRYFEKSF